MKCKFCECNFEDINEHLDYCNWNPANRKCYTCKRYSGCKDDCIIGENCMFVLNWHMGKKIETIAYDCESYLGDEE